MRISCQTFRNDTIFLVFVDVSVPIGFNVPILEFVLNRIVGEFVNVLDGVVEAARPAQVFEDVAPLLKVEESPFTIKTASYFVHSIFDLSIVLDVKHLGLLVDVLVIVVVWIFGCPLNGILLRVGINGVSPCDGGLDGNFVFHFL